MPEAMLQILGRRLLNLGTGCIECPILDAAHAEVFNGFRIQIVEVDAGQHLVRSLCNGHDVCDCVYDRDVIANVSDLTGAQ